MKILNIFKTMNSESFKHIPFIKRHVLGLMATLLGSRLYVKNYKKNKNENIRLDIYLIWFIKERLNNEK